MRKPKAFIVAFLEYDAYFCCLPVRIMENALPAGYQWFMKLKLTYFIPWNLGSFEHYQAINQRFAIESNTPRKVMTFANHQGMDTFAGFEVVGEDITEKVIVFHPSFQTNIAGWNIIEAIYNDFFAFIQQRVLPDMQDWIQDDDITAYDIP